MNETLLFRTANRIIDLLVTLGVPKSTCATALGVSRTTLSSWQEAETKADSPSSAPSTHHLERLAFLVVDRVQSQQRELVTILASDEVHLGTRRIIVSKIRESVSEVLHRLDQLIASWQEIDQELSQLVAKYGRSVIDQLSESTELPPRARGDVTNATLSLEQIEGGISAENGATAIPAELKGKSYRYKYEAVFDVLMHASVDDSAAELAARVRFIHPRGTFLPYRIGEDIRHLLRGDGVYTKLHAQLTENQRSHLKRLLVRLKQRGELGR